VWVHNVAPRARVGHPPVVPAVAADDKSLYVLTARESRGDHMSHDTLLCFSWRGELTCARVRYPTLLPAVSADLQGATDSWCLWFPKVCALATSEYFIPSLAQVANVQCHGTLAPYPTCRLILSSDSPHYRPLSDHSVVMTQYLVLHCRTAAFGAGCTC